MNRGTTTTTIADQDTLVPWRRAVAEALVPMSVVPRNPGPFRGRVATAGLGYLRMATVEADPARLSRPDSPAEAAPEAQVAVVLQLEGRAALSQDGRQAHLGPGDLVLVDTARPYCLDLPERSVFQLFRVPRRALGAAERELCDATATVVGTTEGIGAILRSYLTSVAASAPSYPSAAATRLAATTAGFLATLVTDRTSPRADPADTPAGFLLTRIRDHIDRELADPLLSPTTIAQAHGVSVRYLHRLFEDEPTTVSRLILERRLELCARELTRIGEAAPTVASVARRWGFASPNHFSRAFRAVYGCSPSQWRRLHTVPERAYADAAA
ncbi:helix-turn-helix domain-containing protein [Streptomyces sp. NPDC002573]|uniref:AraC-like ligand-binding domain-containing protein n=1 Tax=Streptomyces sp. NPDC002573 TaxID=3364651 RepID=UPI00368EAB2A